MIKFLIPLVLSTLSFASPQEFKPSNSLNIKNNILVVTGDPVVVEVIGQITSQIQKKNNPADDMLKLLNPAAARPKTNIQLLSYAVNSARAEHRDVLIMINSGGGEIGAPILELFRQMDEAKKEGINITCVVEFAASAATMLLTKCSNRVLLPTAQVMVHSIRTFIPQGMISVQEAQELANTIKKENDKWWEETRKFFDEDYFYNAWNNETFIQATELVEYSKEYVSIIKDVEFKNVQFK